MIRDLNKSMSNLYDLPDSPCIGVCSALFDEVCRGCGRTAFEVSNWVFFSAEEKRAIWARIAREGKALRFRRSGLARRLENLDADKCSTRRGDNGWRAPRPVWSREKPRLSRVAGREQARECVDNRWLPRRPTVRRATRSGWLHTSGVICPVAMARDGRTDTSNCPPASESGGHRRPSTRSSAY